MITKVYVRLLIVLVIYTHFEKIQNTIYTKKSKFLIYDQCNCVIYFNSKELNKNDIKHTDY